MATARTFRKLLNNQYVLLAVSVAIACVLGLSTLGVVLIANRDKMPSTKGISLLGGPPRADREGMKWDCLDLAEYLSSQGAIVDYSPRERAKPPKFLEDGRKEWPVEIATIKMPNGNKGWLTKYADNMTLEDNLSEIDYRWGLFRITTDDAKVRSLLPGISR